MHLDLSVLPRLRDETDASDVHESKPFIVVDDTTYIHHLFIDDGTITRAIIAQECSARMMADSVMSVRVSALEAQISQLRSR